MSTRTAETSHSRLRAVRLGPVSVVVRPRLVIVSVAAALLAFLVLAAGIGMGEYPMSVPDVVRTLFGGGTRLEEIVVWKWRMGRGVVGLCVGAALGFSGALTQSVARNPLASPDVLGITHGAALAVVFVLGATGGSGLIGRLASSAEDGVGLPIVAVLGSTLTALAIWFVAGGGRGSLLQLVLIGVGASIFLSAATTWVMAATSSERAATAKLWLSGSLNGRDWPHAWAPLVCALGALALAGWLAHRLAALSLGPTVAHVLGHNVRLTQAAQLLIAVALAAVAVSAAGPIPFVAFVAPQIAQKLAGTPTPPLICSALIGLLLVTAADCAARVLLPWELPVGIITAVIGAPVLISLVIAMNRKVSA